MRNTAGTQVSNHPEGRFAALGPHAKTLLGTQSWNDYFGPASPLDHLCRLKGKVLRLGADPDTATLTHFAEYLTPLAGKRRRERHCLVQGEAGPELRAMQSLDDENGIFDSEGLFCSRSWCFRQGWQGRNPANGCRKFLYICRGMDEPEPRLGASGPAQNGGELAQVLITLY